MPPHHPQTGADDPRIVQLLTGKSRIEPRDYAPDLGEQLRRSVRDYRPTFGDHLREALGDPLFTFTLGGFVGCILTVTLAFVWSLVL